MYFQTALIAAAASLFALPAIAQITPTSPSGSTVVNAGSDIQALWSSDTSGQWTDVEIQLMTGDNLQMVPLAVLATGIDGTSSTGLDIPCPDVSPYSKIYFLQFTRAGNVSTATWTTRFTIASASGESVAPEQETNYSGNVVQWGTGALVNAAPETITGSGSSNSTSNSTVAAPSMAASSASQAVVASASSVSASAASMTASRPASAAASSASSASASRAAAAPSVSASGAALRGSTVGVGAVLVGLAGLIAI